MSEDLIIQITGISLLILLGIHLFTFSSYSGGLEDNLSWEKVKSRANEGWNLFYFLLLSAVMIHSYEGVKRILSEYFPGKPISRLLIPIWVSVYLWALIPIMG